MAFVPIIGELFGVASETFGAWFAETAATTATETVVSETTPLLGRVANAATTSREAETVRDVWGAYSESYGPLFEPWAKKVKAVGYSVGTLLVGHEAIVADKWVSETVQTLKEVPRSQKRHRDGTIKEPSSEPSTVDDDLVPVENNTSSETTPQSKSKTGKHIKHLAMLSTRPVCVYHSARIPNGNVYKSISVDGFRASELTCGVGKQTRLVFDWNTKDELTNHSRMAKNNVFVQTGIGHKTAFTEGVSTAVQDQTVFNQFNSYILKHTKTYTITNISTTSCYVRVRFLTVKKEDSSNEIITDLADTSYESTQFQGASLIIYPGINTSPIMASDSIKFDMFKHRYRVRRNWKQYKSNTLKLDPGRMGVFSFQDKGAHKISELSLRETVNSFIPGYYRVAVIELIGADQVSSNISTEVSTSTGAISVIENTYLSLKSVPIMRALNYRFSDPVLIGNSRAAYGEIPTFLKANQTFINPETEEVETGAMDAT